MVLPLNAMGAEPLCRTIQRGSIRHLRQLLQRIAHQHLLIIANLISPATSASQYLRAETDDAASIRRFRHSKTPRLFAHVVPGWATGRIIGHFALPRRHFLQQRLFNIQNTDAGEARKFMAGKA